MSAEIIICQTAVDAACRFSLVLNCSEQRSTKELTDLCGSTWGSLRVAQTTQDKEAKVKVQAKAQREQIVTGHTSGHELDTH